MLVLSIKNVPVMLVLLEIRIEFIEKILLSVAIPPLNATATPKAEPKEPEFLMELMPQKLR